MPSGRALQTLFLSCCRGTSWYPERDLIRLIFFNFFFLHWSRDEHGFPCSSAGKESTCNAGDPSLIPASGRATGEGIGYPLQYMWASLVAQVEKNPSAMWETCVGKTPWRRERLPTPAFWPGEFNVLYSPWVHKESDVTGRLSLLLLNCILVGTIYNSRRNIF